MIGILATVALVWGAVSNAAFVVCFTLVGASVNGALPLLAVRMVALGDPRGVGVGTLIAGLHKTSSGTFVGPAVAGLALAHAGLNAGRSAQAACLVCSLALSEMASRDPRPVLASRSERAGVVTPEH